MCLVWRRQCGGFGVGTLLGGARGCSVLICWISKDYIIQLLVPRPLLLKCLVLVLGKMPGRRGARSATPVELDLRFILWNVRTLVGETRLYALQLELERYRIDVAALVETRVRKVSDRPFDLGEGYFIRCAPAVKGSHRGVGFAVRNLPVAYWNPISARVAIIVVVKEKRRIGLVVAYSPTEAAALDERIGFYEELSRAWATLQDQNPEDLLILGDFNAEVGRDFAFARPGILFLG